MTKGKSTLGASSANLGSGLSRIAVPALRLVFLCLEKTPNHLGKIPLERTQRREGNINKAMPAASFHELGYAAISIDVHHHKEAVPIFHLNDLTQERYFSRMAIRFNNNAGYGGTH